MSYYDNVKDNVQGKGSDDDDSSNQFESLKEAAEETSNEPDEEKGDDTPIEVLEEDGLSETAPGKKQGSGSQSSSNTRSQAQQSSNTASSNNSQSSGNPLTGSQASAEANQDLSGLEEKLDRIIEQNERMIEILESFGS